VVVSSRKAANVESALKGLKAEFGEAAKVSGCVCHVGNKEDRAALLKHTSEAYGHLDCLVLNAAVSPPQPPLMKTGGELFDKVMDVNVKSCLLFAQEAVPLLTVRPGGNMVLISSVGGYVPGAPHPMYGLSKTAVFGLTKGLAQEVARLGLRVNCCAPGMIKTDFSKPIWSNKDVESRVARSTLLGRLGEPEEIAGCVCFLASQDAAYVTGEVLVAGGGSLAARL